MKKTLLALLFLGACILPPFEQRSVDLAIELRDESTAIMAKAVEPFADYSDSVTALRTKLKAALAAEAARGHNDESLAQWGLLADPQGALLGGFLTRWEQRGTLGQLFVNEKRTQVMRAFAIIIATEEEKR